MAAVSDGAPDMVSGDDQPIDLSRTPRKPLRVMPPLIPIKLLRAGYAAQQASKQIKTNEITLASLIRGKTDILANKDEDSKCGAESVARSVGCGEASDADDEKEEDDEEDCGGGDEVAATQDRRKRVRLENGAAAAPSGPERWARLDRARSVPQLTPLPPLTPLPLALQRGKSLSESRIAAAAAAAAAERLRRGLKGDTHAASTVTRPSQEEALRLHLQAAALRSAAATATEGASSGGDESEGGGRTAGSTAFNNSWIYVGYYSQLLHRFQAQELLRQLAIQHQSDSLPHQKLDPTPDAKSSLHVPEEESNDNRRKQARPLTGKHVRPGTGASPATLLTLRRKIQARQQLLDSKRLLE